MNDVQLERKIPYRWKMHESPHPPDTKERKGRGIRDNLIRQSVGLGKTRDMVADLWPAIED